jgi:hypothetical protein
MGQRYARFDRNLNTGERLASGSSKMVIAFQTICDDAAHPSHVLLPIISMDRTAAS